MMSLNEFKAWLSGLKDGGMGCPTPEQWALITKRLETVEALTIRPAPYNPLYPSTGSFPAVTCGNIGVAQ
jgi:hypothetical protein